LKLVLATKNNGKVDEYKSLLADLDVNLSSLLDLNDLPDVIEDGSTFLENAIKKAKEISSATGAFVMADDSGLVVDALGGAPGIHSARYSGVDGDGKYAANNEKLLKEMKGVPEEKRTARFVCVIAIVSPSGDVYSAEGRCEGKIGHILTGKGGFGYDPLFYLPEYDKTMAELSMEEKNKISHRGLALQKIYEILVEILSKKGNT